MSDAYSRLREFYQDISGSVVLTTAAVTQDLIADKASETIFLQKVHAHVTTGSAKTWDIKDKNGTPVEIAGPFDTTTDGSHFDQDFGARGIPLTEGKGLQAVISAAGAAGIITWEGYRKRTAGGAP